MVLLETDMTKWAWSKRWDRMAPSVWMNTDGSTVSPSKIWNRVRPDDFGDIFSVFGLLKYMKTLHSNTWVFRHTSWPWLWRAREAPTPKYSGASSAAPAHLETQKAFEWHYCQTNWHVCTGKMAYLWWSRSTACGFSLAVCAGRSAELFWSLYKTWLQPVHNVVLLIVF